jgi:tRNA A-37 threonylcarbamoyl transferase component Bud32
MEFEQIGKYKILGTLGQGAMGEVYKAHDPILIRDVAIKTISASLAADSDLRKRFYREAQSAARLNHPNIVTVYDFGEERGKVYMAMELLEGVDLKKIIARRALWRIEQKLNIFEQICDGLAFAHAKDVIHRDLKPSNIRVHPNGQVKIMDFGLARLGASEITRAGTVMGTPHYMSPEQVRGERVTTRSDIFSLGGIFYEVLTDHKAFDGESVQALLFQVLEKQPPSVLSLAPELPALLVQIVEKALAKDANLRYAHAGEMREALRRVRKVLSSGTADEASVATLSGIRLPEGALASDTKAVGDISTAAEPMRIGGIEASRVEGSLARDVARARAPRPLLPATLLGRARTHIDASAGRAAAPVGVPSRVAVYAAGGLLLVLAAAGGAYWWSTVPTGPGERDDAEDVATQQVGALTQALVGTQLELARRNLADKDYRGAVRLADRALKIDPENAEARAVHEKARSILDGLEAAASEASAAFAKGDTDEASRALSRVLAIDPSHPVATQLSKNLNSVFRVQAEEARRNVTRSRVAAEALDGDSLPAFGEATALGRQAEGLLKKGEFVPATQKFLQARDAFDRAARTAEQQLARQTAAAASPTAPPTISEVPPVITPSPLTAPPVVLPPVIPPPVPVVATEETAIRRVLADYGSAIERKDLALFRTVKPDLSPDEEKRLRDAFSAVRSQQVGITVSSIKVSGSQATVHVLRHDTIDGKRQGFFRQIFTVVKGPSGWVIEGIGQ